MRGSLALAVGLFAICHPAVASQESERQHFSVRNSIEMERFVSLGSTTESPHVLWAPGKDQYLFVTQRGNLASDKLVDSVWVGQIEGGPPTRLLERKAQTELDTISDVKWLDTGEIGLIFSDGDGIRQAFAVDPRSGVIRALTRSETDVSSFAYSAGMVVYYAVDPEPYATTIDVDEHDLFELVDPKLIYSQYPRVTLFHARDGNPGVKIPSVDIRLLPAFQGIWPSPDGRWAVALEPASGWPENWKDYKVGNQQAQGFHPDLAEESATSIEIVNRNRFRLIDLSSGQTKLVFPAPTGLLSYNGAPITAAWLPGSRVVVLTNTYQRLPANDAKDFERISSTPAIVALDVKTNDVEIGKWLPNSQHRVRAVWVEDGAITVSTSDKSTGKSSYERFEKGKSGWSGEVVTGSTNLRSLLTVNQGLNSTPKLFRRDSKCQCDRKYFDPNPQFNGLRLNHVEEISWTDANGTEWRGSLTFPGGYDKVRKYPLVVQTHGYHPDEWLSDGPDGTTTAFAAQPLASAGFLVLQIEDNPKASTGDQSEGRLNADGYLAGIQKVVNAGIVDPDRIGVIGWSITSSYVIRLIADNPGLVRAAILSDGAQFGYLAHLMTVNGAPQVREQYLQMTGGSILPDRIEDYVKADPQYRLVENSPPIRFEAIGPGSLVGMWEAYSILRRDNRPVDFILYPSGSHSLKMPRQRMESQGGSVDWFGFWLSGEFPSDQTAMNDRMKEWENRPRIPMSRQSPRDVRDR